MIEYLAYGMLLAFGFHIGGKVAKKYGLGPRENKKVKILKGVGINTKTYVSKLQGGM